MSTTERVDYKPFSSDPSPAFAALRETDPVHLHDDGEHRFYAVSRHAEVRQMLTDRATWSIRYGQMHTYTPGQGLNVDPPQHTAIRRVLNPHFRVERVAQFAAEFAGVARRMVDGFIARGGRGDFSADFAALYPVHIAAIVLGIDPSRQEELRQWTFGWTQALNSGDMEAESRWRQTIYAYFEELLAARRAEIAAGTDVAEDLVTLMARATHEDGTPFSDEELLPSALLLLIGGIDTTGLLLTNCMYRLLAERTNWERLCAEPELIVLAIEESLRRDSPVFGVFRTNDRETSLGGTQLARDTKVQMLFASANRDPAVFADPDTFSLDRDLNELRRNHLAFGGGIHACIGNSVARLSARIALTELTRRMPSLRLAGEPERYQSVEGAIAVNNGLTFLPVAWDERS